MANDSWLMGALAAQDAYRRGDDPPWPPPPQPGAVFNSPWERGVAIASDYAGRETPPASATEEPPEMGSLLGMGRAGETVRDIASDTARAIPAGAAQGLEHGLYYGSLLSHDPSDKEFVTDQFAQHVTPMVGYDPHTAPGRYAKEISSVMANPINWSGPGGAAVKGAWNALSGTGGQAAADAVMGTSYEPYEQYARMAGSFGPLVAERAWALTGQAVRALPEGQIGVGGGKITQREVPPTKGEQVANVAETPIEAPAITKAQQRKLESYPYFGYAAQRDYKPGIYKDPRLIAEEAAVRTEPEHPALKSLFGVTRDDLWEIGGRGARQGNVDPAKSVIWMPDKGRGSYVADAIMNPKNAQRMIDAMAEAERFPQLTRGMDAWYVMDPAFQRLKQLVGHDEAVRQYSQLNAVTTPFSSNSDVLKELNRGTAANMMVTRGEFPKMAQYGGVEVAKRGADFPPELTDVIPHLRHSTHIPPVERYLATGSHGFGKDTVKNPLYSSATGVPETGFQTSLSVPDAHFARASGASDVRQNADPGAYMGGAEYRSFGPWYRDNVARPLGLEAVPAQARQWGVFGPQTGVKTTLGAPKLELLAQSIWERAHRLGIDPAKLRDDVLTGKGHATWLLPAITAGGFAKYKMGDLADPDQYRQ